MRTPIALSASAVGLRRAARAAAEERNVTKQMGKSRPCRLVSFDATPRQSREPGRQFLRTFRAGLLALDEGHYRRAVVLEG